MAPTKEVDIGSRRRRAPTPTRAAFPAPFASSIHLLFRRLAFTLGRTDAVHGGIPEKVAMKAHVAHIPDAPPHVPHLGVGPSSDTAVPTKDTVVAA